MGNRELKELICTTNGHELRRGRMLEGWGVQRKDKRKKLEKL